MASRVAVLVERGRTRSFACALDWPGWARSARSPELALAALESYRPRYGGVLARAGVAAPTGRLAVTEELAGDATTDFGAPSQVAAADRRALRAADRARLASILSACWSAFDEAVAAAPTLAVGPRGGGRSLDKVAAHVADAEVSYARRLGLRVASSDAPRDVATARLRGRVVAVLTGDEAADREAALPVRYLVRRIAWHVCDHLFEIEDRAVAS